MNLDDIRDQLGERLSQIQSQIQESTLYITLKEQFDNLNPNIQKGIVFAFFGVICLFLVSIPMGYISSAATFEEEAATKTQLIDDLSSIKRKLSQIPSIPKGLNANRLKTTVNGKLKGEKLLDEQIMGVKVINERPKFIPKDAEFAVVEARVSKINLNQLVALGHALHNVHSNAKLSDLEVTTNSKNDHYLDALFRVVSFSAPEAPKPPPPSANKKKNKKKRGRKKRKRDK